MATKYPLLAPEGAISQFNRPQSIHFPFDQLEGSAGSGPELSLVQFGAGSTLKPFKNWFTLPYTVEPHHYII